MILLLKSAKAGALSAAMTAAITATLLVAQPAFAQKADSTPAKKELIGRILKLQQQAIEQLTVSVLTRPVNDLAQKIVPALRNVPEDKREATAKSIDATLRKFVDDNGKPLVEKGRAIIPSTMGVTLDEKFTEDELKQLAAWLESPVSKKFSEAAPELQQAYTKKLMDDNGKLLDEKFNALQADIAKQLGLSPAPNGAAASGAAKPAAKPSTTTPKK